MQLASNQDQVLDLLTKLKNSGREYPSDMFAFRRESYVKQVNKVGLGVGIGRIFKKAAKNSRGAGAVSAATGKVLEIVLIASIVIEAGTAAYLYRDKLANLIHKYTGSANVQVTLPPASNSSSSNPEFLEATKTPFATPSEIPSYTAVPPIVINNNSGAHPHVSATPKPKNDNGNHYGNTPKPDRTKEKKPNNENK